MAIEVFWSSGSPFSWRVLLALEAKQLPYESHLLELSRRDHKQPDYLRINPRGQVPTLRDGDYVIYESIAILAYLDRKYPQSPLFGATPRESGDVWRAVCETAAYLDEPTDAFILPIYFGQSVEKADEIRATLPLIHAELSRLEAIVRDRAWLATAELSAADIVAFPMIMSLLRAASKPAAATFRHDLTPFATRFPALSRWITRIEGIPGYERTYPPHWRV